MEPLSLDQLTPQDLLATTRVLVLRKWEHRGNTDVGPVLHVGMVLVDQKQNAMYAEIPGDLADEKSNLFEEGSTYHLSRFKVANLKQRFRPVHAPFMIYITLNTQATPWEADIETFPRYVYDLTPLPQLDSKIGNTTYLLDVMGAITGISQIRNTHHAGATTTNLNRDVFIKDHENNSLKITLWGNKATKFTVNDVYNSAEQTPIIILFVGCIAKRYADETYLNGNASCDWYFNPDIEEAKPYYAIFSSQKIPLQLPDPINELPPEHEFELPESKTVSEMISADAYTLLDQEFLCTVTITSVSNRTRWWFPACTKCNRSASQEEGGYKCYLCNWSNYIFRYKLTFTTADETGSTEMFCFDNVAKNIVGRPCESVMKLSPVIENSIPPEIAAIVANKYTFVVTINRQSIHYRNRVFQILAIYDYHGRQHSLPNQPVLSSPPRMLALPSTQQSPSSAMKKLSTACSSKEEAHVTEKDSPSTARKHNLYLQKRNTPQQEPDATKTSTSDSLGSPPKKPKQQPAKSQGNRSASGGKTKQA